jgi:hypothetical protein
MVPDARRAAARRFRALMCGVVAACLLLAPAAAADWRAVGGDPGPAARYFVTAAGIGGVPHVAFADASGALRVRRLSDDGANWLQLGDAPVNASGTAFGSPSLIDAAGVPYLAWTQRNAPSDPPRLHVARFDASTSTWSEPDAAALQVHPSDEADTPNLAFFNGQVYVAWTERLLSDNPPSQLYVKRLTTAGWEQAGSGSLNGNVQHGAGAPYIATSGGKLWVAWTEVAQEPYWGPVTFELLVKRLTDDGSAWEEPAARPTTSASIGVRGLTDGGGTPYLLYGESPSSLHVKRLAGSPAAWQEVGGQLNAEPGSLVYDAALGSAGGVPYVAWGNRTDDAPIQTHVARLNTNGDGWEEPVARSLNADPARFAASVAVTNNLPAPYVGWTEWGPNLPGATIVKRLEPSLSPQAVDFAPQPLGTASDPRSVVFTNLSTSPVHFAAAAAAVGGPDAAAFGISSDGCSSTTVERGGSCAVGVAFTPQAARAHQATLSLASDAVGSPHATSLSGTSPGPLPPPGPVGISINGGAQYTNDRDVHVHVVWPLGANTLLLSNDGGFAGSEPTPVVEDAPWRLESSGAERFPKTVYARFDGETQTFTDDIVLDETAPTLLSATFAAKSRVSIAARDRTSGLRWYQLTSRKAHPGKRHRFHRTVRYKGRPRKLYVRVFDRAGNGSRWVRAKHRKHR